jgi:hypothetical protein
MTMVAMISLRTLNDRAIRGRGFEIGDWFLHTVMFLFYGVMLVVALLDLLFHVL